jgi:hypothetical protein
MLLFLLLPKQFDILYIVYVQYYFFVKNIIVFISSGEFLLKGQLYEISDPRFFHQSTPPRALIHRLKLFRIWIRIRRDNRFESRQNSFHRGQ